MSFHLIAGGDYMGRISEKARAFAAGDLNRLAAAGLERLLSEWDVPHVWRPDLHFEFALDYDTEVLVSTSDDPDGVAIVPTAPYTVAARVCGDTLVFHGATYFARWRELIAAHGPLVPTNRFKSMDETLRAWRASSRPMAPYVRMEEAA